jgi:hypothetical protein
MAELKDDIIDVSAMAEKLLHPFRLIVKYYKLTIMYFVAGIGLSIALKFLLPQIYQANFILKSNEQHEKVFINMLINIEDLAKNNDHEAIASILNISLQEAKYIKKVELKHYSNNALSDTSDVASIDLFLKKGGDFIKIQNNILNFLETSDYYKQVKEKRLSSFDSVSARLKNEMLEIDSVKRIMVNAIKAPVASGGGMVYSAPIDPVKAYERNLWHYYELLKLKKQIEKTKSFEIMKPVFPSTKPVEPRLKQLMMYLLPLSLLLALLHTLWLDRRNSITN